MLTLNRRSIPNTRSERGVRTRGGKTRRRRGDELFEQRANLGHALGAARRRARFDSGQ